MLSSFDKHLCASSATYSLLIELHHLLKLLINVCIVHRDNTYIREINKLWCLTLNDGCLKIYRPGQTFVWWGFILHRNAYFQLRARLLHPPNIKIASINHQVNNPNNEGGRYTYYIYILNLREIYIKINIGVKW